jgi:hypothetical protein
MQMMYCYNNCILVQKGEMLERDNLCRLLDEIISKCEWVMEESMKHNSEDPYLISPLVCLKQISEFADGANILIKSNSNDSAAVVIRSLFEVELGLRYMIKEDYERRSLCFLYFYHKKKEFQLLRGKIGTKEHFDLIKIMEEDKNVSNDTIEALKNNTSGDADLNLIQTTLNNDIYSEIAEYYNNSKNKRKHWFSLLNGPENIGKLTKDLGMFSQYSINYDLWSQISHGIDIVHHNLAIKDGYAQIILKRNPKGGRDNAINAIQIVRRSLMNYIVEKQRNIIVEFGDWLAEYNKRLEPYLTT